MQVVARLRLEIRENTSGSRNLDLPDFRVMIVLGPKPSPSCGFQERFGTGGKLNDTSRALMFADLVERSTGPRGFIPGAVSSVPL
jgi:hypothetical protein